MQPGAVGGEGDEVRQWDGHGEEDMRFGLGAQWVGGEEEPALTLSARCPSLTLSARCPSLTLSARTFRLVRRREGIGSGGWSTIV